MPNFAGALSSLLMSLPLVAVPCLAVFGLPSIGPATAEAEADDAIELGPSVASTDSLGTASAQPPATGGFSPIVDAASTTSPANLFAEEPRADRQNIDRTSDRRGASANHALGIEGNDHTVAPTSTPISEFGAPPGGIENPFADVQGPDPAKPNSSDNAISKSGNAPAASRTSWEQVIAQLKSKGVEDFYLANGETDGEFYFTCSFATGDNTLQRFEAEGASPMVAASAVLAEVESWQDTH